MPDGATIQRMFTEVAPTYDRCNRVLSMGIDVLWRRRAVAIADVQSGELALDVCAGTGDLTMALAGAGARAVGADFCAAMLQRAAHKGAAPPPYLAADALQLPFADGQFDLCTVAFGIRNVADPVAGLREMARVTRTGGRVVVLEFCRPRVPVLGALYLFYFRRILPLLGRLLSGSRTGAYRYLPDSVMQFPERAQFLAMMQAAGLQRPAMHLLSGGVAAVYRGEVGR